MPQAPEPQASRRSEIADVVSRFARLYAERARFKEDRELATALATEATPVWLALRTALAATNPALHESFALLTLLARHAASLGGTPGVPLAIVDAVVQLLAEQGVTIAPGLRDDLILVAVEGYCAARDERSTHLLRTTAAERQVAVELGTRCFGIYLAGSHDEADLTPTLERFARDLLRADTLSCLLDVSRLWPIDEELARAIGRFCAQAATLGVCCFLTGASDTLRDQLARWSVTGGATMLVDDHERARTLALAAAGIELAPRRRWMSLASRWFLPARRTLVR